MTVVRRNPDGLIPADEIPASGAGAPADATYITQTPNATLTNEQALSVLATGVLKSTTGTGVVSIAIPGTDFETAGAAAAAVAAHVAAGDPHPQYLTAAEGAAAFDALGAATAAVAAHVAAGDPHPQYLTAAEGDAAYVPLARTVTAGAGLTGGGDLSANRTLDVVAHADGTIVVNANDIQVGALVIGNVPNDLITYAKIQNVSAISKLLGRGSAAGAGDAEEITLGTNLSMAGTTLNATGGGSASMTAVTVTVAYGVQSATAVVVDAAISGTSKIMLAWGTTAETDENTPAMCNVQFSAIPGTGQMTVEVAVNNGNDTVGGAYKLNYMVA